MRTNDDEIYDMSIKQSEGVAKRAMIEQKVHPGFQCFFKDFLERKSITFGQCFQQLIAGSRNLDQVKHSIPNLLKMKYLSIEDKKKILGTKQHKFLYLYKDQLGTQKTQLIEQTSNQENNIHKLQRRLLFYQQNKQKLLNDKKQEFRIKKIKQEQAKPIINQPKSIKSIPQGNLNVSKDRKIL